MDVKIPEIGESIHEALIAEWLKEDGAAVTKDDNLCELETDKINVEVPAEIDGVLHIKVKAGETVEIGTVIATIEEGTGKLKEKEETEKESQKEFGKSSKKETKQVSKERSQDETEEGDEDHPVNPAARRLAREKEIDP